MKVKIILVILIVLSFVLGWFCRDIFFKNSKSIKTNQITIKSKSLEKYSIENLSKTTIKSGSFEIVQDIKNLPDYNSYIFRLTFDADLTRKNLKQTSGQINIPNILNKTSYPVVVIVRGYIDQKTYKTGDGSRNASAFFAKNGFITVAPDFLGYGTSDSEASNIFESRFQSYTTILNLLSTIRSQKFSETIHGKWDKKNIFIWGHSNGGQISLTILEITSEDFPTVLWAPVSKPFPYSILYYTDESNDHGKLIRHELSLFENDYEAENYSLTNFFNKIKAPLQINQGGNDDAVPVSWTDSLVKSLKKEGLTVSYNKYPRSNHDMVPDWNSVITKDLEFYNKYLKTI